MIPVKKSRRFGLISRVLQWASPLHLPRTKLMTKPYGSVDTYLTRVQPLALLKAVFGPQTAPLTREWPRPYRPSGCSRRSRWDSSLQLQSSCQPDSCGPKPVLALWPKQTRDFNCPPPPPTFVHWKFILWKNNNKTTWVSCKGNKETLHEDRTIPATYLWITVFTDYVFIILWCCLMHLMSLMQHINAILQNAYQFLFFWILVLNTQSTMLHTCSTHAPYKIQTQSKHAPNRLENSKIKLHSSLLLLLHCCDSCCHWPLLQQQVYWFG